MGAAPVPGPLFDPSSEAFLQERYGVYRLLRDEAPVIFPMGRESGIGMAFRYDDVATILRSPDFVRQRSNAGVEVPPPPDQYRPITELLQTWMLLRDPPDHTRLRGLVSKAFTPKVAESMRDFISATAHHLLDLAEGQATMDLMAAYAGPLPVIVIAKMLGVPDDDRALFRKWAQYIAAYLGGFAEDSLPAEAPAAFLDMADYVRRLIAERRREPQDDLITALIAAEENNQRLSAEEVVGTVIMLLTAGHETTVNLIGNGVYALLRHPEEWERLQRTPDLLPTAVEELLRFDAPVQMSARSCRSDTELSGVPIKRGDAIYTVFGSANRDGSVFTDPDRLDLGRDPNPHLSFGHGAHYCVGAALARLEGQIALDVLRQRHPGLRLEQEPRYVPNMAFRGLESLIVTS